MRFLSSVGEDFAGAPVLLRRLRSRFPAKLELKDPNDPCECDEPREIAVLEIDELLLEVSIEVVEVALKLENPEPLLDFLRRPLEGDLDALPSGRSLLATACAISVMAAGSFSGGECFQRSNGLSSSHGFSGVVVMSIAGVVGCRLGDEHLLGRDFSVTVQLEY